MLYNDLKKKKKNIIQDTELKNNYFLSEFYLFFITF